MTLTWASRPSTQADPMGDWLAQTQTERGPVGWRPRIIYTEPGVTTGQTLANLRSFFAAHGDYRVSHHDLAHWLHLDQTIGSDGQSAGPCELIVYEKADIEGFFLPEKLRVFLEVSDEAVIVGANVGKSASGVEATALTPETTLQQRVLITDGQAGGGNDGQPLVVTAIIDHAIPFAHGRFRQTLTHSRVDAVWLQGRGGTTSLASDVVIGRQISGADIDAFLGRIGHDIDSETGIYSEIANPAGPAWQAGNRPLAQSFCHGGMMLDIAAGRDMDEPKASQHRVLAVELPPQLVAQTNGFMHEIYVKSAMNWIWYAAQKLYADYPHEVLLNYSFGDHSGRHDGQGMLDADFQLRLDRDEFAAITVSAGNAFQADCHAEFTAAEITEGQEVYLCLQPDDKTASFVQFWLDGDYDALPFALSVIPPSASGGTPVPVVLNEDTELCDVKDPSTPLARLYVQRDKPDYALPKGVTATARTRVTLGLRPTASDDPATPTAPAGRWTMSFSAKAGVSLPVDERVMLWVERGDSLAGFPARGRQAYLDHPNHLSRQENGRWSDDLVVTGDPIKRRNTLSGNACAAGVVVAGAARGSGGAALAAYSSAGSGSGGPTIEPNGPTVAVQIELSDARRSFLAAGTGSGSVRLANGTSAATAYLSRKLADAILDGTVTPGGASLKTDLRNHAIGLASKAPGHDGARVGAGTIAVQARREMLRRPE